MNNSNEVLTVFREFLNAMYKLGGEVENIIKNPNYIGKKWAET